MTLPRRRDHDKRPGPPADPALAASLLRLGASSPRYLGHALALLRAASGETAGEQAERLGITEAALAHLSICPAPGQGGRAEGLAGVAARFGIPLGVLAEALAEAGRLGRGASGADQKGDGDGGE